MAKIKIRGLRRPIEADHHTATEIKRKLAQFKEGKKSGDTPITVGEWSGALKHVEWVDTTAGNQPLQESKIDYIRELDRVFFERYKSNIERPIETRAKQIGMFRALYTAMVGVPPEGKILTDAMRVQLDFFKKNPYRTVCDPSEFYQLIHPHQNRTRQKLVESAVVRLIERRVLADIKMAKKNNH